MKKFLKAILASTFIIIFSLLFYKIVSKITAKKELENTIKHIPKFSYYDIQGKTFDNQNLKKDTSVVFIYFNSECDFCQTETEMIKSNLEKFKKVQLIFISSENLNKIKTFAKNHHFTNSANIHFLQDKQSTFTATFDVTGLPTIVIYNQQKKLIAKIKGQIKIDHILEKLNP
ncbi:peroxiredoxin family protein [Flavobacterium ustbae]|uniref:peroxiredoxin family protein n=1 Tax=Flavobacterium ustbae TaxID=2488790 RepID=UPI000F76C768|nr:redoxin domain-containing protein [Flavobacterium ustbae]